jgi:hypothetical protein
MLGNDGKKYWSSINVLRVLKVITWSIREI